MESSPGNLVLLFALYVVAMCSLVLVKAELFDLYFAQSTVQNVSSSEELCQDLGYDGLGIIRSPEAYAYLMRISEHARFNRRRGIFIGLRYHSDTGVMTWEDGTPLAMDEFWDKQFTQSDMEARPYGSFHVNGVFKISDGSFDRFAVCGNRNDRATEAHGTIFRGQQPTGVNASLSLTTTPSFLACTLACAHNPDCRVAEFNADDLSCLTLGTDSYSSLAPQPQSCTFVRNGFL